MDYLQNDKKKINEFEEHPMTMNMYIIEKRQKNGGVIIEVR